MMKILVTGAMGQLGQEFIALTGQHTNLNFIFKTKEELDITVPIELRGQFLHYEPDIVINCAAYTKVDDAEIHNNRAYLINNLGPSHLAKLCREFGSTLIHISTDYVFDGKTQTPYKEIDPAKPLSVYGDSKLKGEEACLEHCKDTYIFRTSWLYSNYGHNFLKTILNLGSTKKELKVVADQMGTPTSVHDLAKAIIKLISLKRDSYQVPAPGIYHYSNMGIASWFDFAKEIITYLDMKCNVQPIPTKDYPMLAKRPFYSVLDKSKVQRELALDIPDWKTSLKETLGSLTKKTWKKTY
ncbi:dTDP-4-dehydrorhamnose reductase [Fulvivirgaceae bacterium BMA10]|uniref:dTDP-4-dehydrorhamnose reductase n=1 Tax=Splendidivirga corallicola TaxID=3051826 RepID=A0ABT8KHN1_9BACT|nr:dTDP-4-dehydrorhamnose reductase [Fulvivirgaceae bacterium BMA10]